ncbi:MAG: 3'-5' exonuclease [Erysipelotrichaceae bacterium]|jgi:DNA polymerase-3 subunit epsilon|nr:3'-5' exonuclease [Erysipelotrichaceae bacterium]
MRISSIDFETANQSMTSACSVAIVTMEDGEIIDSYSSLIKPHPSFSHFSSFNIGIHHIFPQDVEEAPEFDQVYIEMLPYLQDHLVIAHNAPFDMEVLKQSCYLYRLPLPDFRYGDTVRLARRCFPYLQNHKLNTVCDYLGIQLQHHDAFSDARGCLLILLNVMNLLETFDIDEVIQQTLWKISRF